MWKLLQYKTVFDDLYNQCDTKLKAAIDQRVQRLAIEGNMARAPVSKPLEDGIFECRARAKRQHVRFLYFFQPGKIVVFAVATFKDQSKVPRSAIDKAKKIRDALLKSPELIDEFTKIH
jgi:putative component of toxin-antitoxin plasmid stabilization module